MHKTSLERVLQSIKDGDKVLDIGGWANPFERADYVIDAMPYDTRGQHGQTGLPERFTKNTWIQWNICDHKPWPFKDKEFDFVICSHVLEDIRDPLWVCSEMIRISKRGYIETPTRAAELLFGVQGFEYTGFQHHRWFVETENNKLFFTQKTPVAHSGGHGYYLIHTDSILRFFWENSFQYEERFAGLNPGDTKRQIEEWQEKFEKSMPAKIKIINEVCRYMPSDYMKKNTQKLFRSMWKLARI